MGMTAEPRWRKRLEETPRRNPEFFGGSDICVIRHLMDIWVF
jgi:hypothetical protein